MSRAFTTDDRTRVLTTTGIHNFRDYGGYPAKGGGRLVRGVLYRSGELRHATDRDLELLDSIRLTTVVDLRGTNERLKSPWKQPAGFSASIHFADGETAHAAPHVVASAGALDAAEARRRMLKVYSGMPFRPLLIDIFRLYLTVLAESQGSTLVHCLAGKDRTGLAVALLHSALGVHRDDIFADYLLTNAAGNSEARIKAIALDLEERFGARLSEGALQVLAGVDAQYLERAFGAINDEYGSIDAYIARVLRISPAVREALARRLVI